MGGSHLVSSNPREGSSQRGFSNLKQRRKGLKNRIDEVKKKFKNTNFSPQIRIFSPSNQNSKSPMLNSGNLKPKEKTGNSRQKRMANLKIKVKDMPVIGKNYFSAAQSPFRESEADSVSSGALNGITPTPIKDTNFDSLKFIFSIDEAQEMSRQNRRGGLPTT